MTIPAAQRRRLVVVGSGLSGSLLVQALAGAGADVDVVVIDRRTGPNHGRSWADWDTPSGAVDAALRFPAVRVHGRAWTRTAVSTLTEYAVRDGDSIDRVTDDALGLLGGRRLVGSVTRVDEAADAVVVSTDGGTLEADLVLDSVGLSPARPAAAAWLHVAGLGVTTDAPRFEPGVVTLMDFRVARGADVRFCYVLPASTHSALVELTAFSAVTEPSSLHDDLHDDLRAELDRRLGAGGWCGGAEERASIPLCAARATRRATTHGRHVLIGSAAGLVKASTGYGYHLMARDAHVLAAEIATDRPPRGLRRRRRHTWMDAVFLRLAVDDPPSTVAALERLFEVHDMDRIVRFLHEESTLRDELAIVTSLPVRPFLRAAAPPRRERPVSSLETASTDRRRRGRG